MRIAVLVKVVPDTYGERRIDLETGLVDRSAGEAVVDEVGERAVEAALTITESLSDATVTVISMGPSTIVDPMRKTLAMGADSAVLVVDEALAGADLTLTAEVLAAAVRRSDPDLVLLGNVSTDGAAGVLGAMLAENLGFAQATNLSAVAVDGMRVTGTRQTDAGSGTLEAALPAVVSITEALPDPRFPSMRNTMAARRKPIETISVAELGVDPAGEDSARSIVIAATERPSRGGGLRVIDDGSGGTKLAEYLIENALV